MVEHLSSEQKVLGSSPSSGDFLLHSLDLNSNRVRDDVRLEVGTSPFGLLGQNMSKGGHRRRDLSRDSLHNM